MLDHIVEIVGEDIVLQVVTDSELLLHKSFFCSFSYEITTPGQFSIHANV
jgi:hypothetical protein